MWLVQVGFIIVVVVSFIFVAYHILKVNEKLNGHLYGGTSILSNVVALAVLLPILVIGLLFYADIHDTVLPIEALRQTVEIVDVTPDNLTSCLTECLTTSCFAE